MLMNSTKNIEKIKDNLNYEQKKTLLDKLDSAGFKITNLGHVLLIDVKNPKNGHPKTKDDFLPIGKIRFYFQEMNGTTGFNDHCPSYLALINLNEKFPEDYHSKIRRIVLSI